MAHTLLRRKGVRIVTVLILVVAASMAVYIQFFRTAMAEEAPTFKTAKVRTGDIKISVSATGSLAAAREVVLGFATSGRVAEVSAQVGQKVASGDLLIALEDTEAQAAVTQAEFALRTAELKREELSGESAAAALATASANLKPAELSLARLLAGPSTEELAATAAALEAQRASVATAQAAVVSAQAILDRLLAGASPEDVAIAERKVELAKNTLWASQAQRDAVCGRSGKDAYGAECDVAQASVQKNEEEVRIAELQLQLVRQGSTAATLAGAEAQLQSARGQLASARAQLLQTEASSFDLQAGPDPEAVAAAEARLAQAEEAVAKLSEDASDRALEGADLAVRQAQVNLDLATERLQRTELRAPFDGMVVGLEAASGEQIGTSPVVSLASTSQGLVRFHVEETNLGVVSEGAPVAVSFRAVPESVFSGSLTWVSPVLSLVDGVAAAEALAALDEDEELSSLRAGMEADVEVIAALAEDALLVPVDALRALGEDSFAVFVVNESNELSLRPVEIGLRDFANAQVVSGLEPGDIVSTGTIDTN